MDTTWVFNGFTLLGGLAFFLFGMNVMSGGLEKLTGGKLQKTLNKMTSNPVKSLLLGMGITIAIQSSSAMTVMLVGLVNSGIMQLSQTVGVIMGSNIGTTLTAWILSLAGIESDNFWIKLLKPESFAPIGAVIGIILLMMSKKTKRRDIGSIMVGFAVLMYGMSLMSDAVEPLKDMPEFSSIMTAFNNPLLGVLVGAVVTGIIQSSAASVGILQTLSLTGSMTYGMALPIIMGQNIGTCVTALISSIGVSKNAKRVSVIHICFNVFGTAICLILFYGTDMIFNYAFLDYKIDMVGIALCHSIFNIFTTMLLIPFQKYLVKIAEVMIQDKDEKKKDEIFIDERIFDTPSFAIAECRKHTNNMAELCRETLFSAIDLLDKFDEKQAQLVDENEGRLDTYEDKLGNYLVKASSYELSDADSKEITILLHTIGDLERIGDHAVNLSKAADEMATKNISFSEQAKKELAVLIGAVKEITVNTFGAIVDNNMDAASDIEPLEQVIDMLIAEIRIRHINRLKVGTCTIELGFILSDLLTNFERISDHCSNLALRVIQIKKSDFNSHEYINEIKESNSPDFIESFNKYKDKYHFV